MLCSIALAYLLVLSHFYNLRRGHFVKFVYLLSKNDMKTNLVIALTCALTACNTPQPQAETEVMKPVKKIAEAGWLVGTWSGNSGERSNYETWEKYNDSTYVGRSYSIQVGDTVSSESIRLVQQGEIINYIPTVEGQNNDMPVMFTLISSDSNKLIFENPAHDFPQRITYRMVSHDSLIAEISGLINGEPHAQEFPMRRVE